MPELKGVLTAMVTPFAEDGSVDEASARKLARHLVDNGSHGVVVAGTTGESPTLSDDEDVALVRAVRDELGEGPTVICGTGTNDTSHSVHLTQAAVEAGADAVLVVTPYYNKPNDAGILAHYEAVAEAAGGTRVIVYNIPSRVVVNIEPGLLAELGRIDNIVAVKQANNDQIDQVEGLDVLAGNDDIFLRCLQTGGAGGILVASHVVGNELRGDLRRGAGGRRGSRRRARRRHPSGLRRAHRHHQPDPDQGRGPDAGVDPVSPNAPADGRGRRRSALRGPQGARGARAADCERGLA